MPPLPVISNVFRVALNWSDGTSQRAVNVMHFHDDVGGHVAHDVGVAIDGEADAAMWSYVLSSAFVDSLSIIKLDGTSAGITYLPTNGGAWSGGTGGQQIPQVATLVKMQTAKRGRSYRGRVFLPFTAEAGVSGGQLLAGNLAAWQSAWDDFIADMLGAGYPLVVASYKHSTAEDVTGVVCESFTGTQRRRMSRLR